MVMPVPEHIPVWEDDFAWFAVIKRGRPRERLAPGTRLPNGKVVIDAICDPAQTWLKADPLTGEVTLDEERSVGIRRTPANDARANPQYWACKERLNQIEVAAGPEARHEEFMRMRDGQLPAIEHRHVAEANLFRSGHDLPPASAV